MLPAVKPCCATCCPHVARMMPSLSPQQHSPALFQRYMAVAGIAGGSCGLLGNRLCVTDTCRQPRQELVSLF